MEVEIYLDSLFILNLIMNLWILELLQYKFALKVSFFRELFAAGLGAGVYIALFFLPGNSLCLQFFGTAVSLPAMTMIFLPKRKRRFFWKVLGMGLFYGFVIAGVLRTVFVKWNIFTGQDLSVSILLLGAYICVKIGKWCMQKNNLKKKKSIYEVTLTSAGQSMQIKALFDTGNSLIEPISKRPVCLMEEELLAHITLENPLFLRAIPYRSVGCEQGMLYGVEIPKLEIYAEEKEYIAEQVICAGVAHKLSTRGTYQMILHPALFAEENRRSERKE